MSHRIPTLFGTNTTEPAVPERETGNAGMPKDTAPALQTGWQAEKQYYTIGEVAELFGLRASNIRFWTTEFNLKVRTNRKGDRLYTGRHILTLRAIYHLVKEKGYTLSGAKAKLQKGGNTSVAVAAGTTPEKAAQPAAAPPVTEQAQPIIYTLSLQQSLLQLRNRLVALRNQLT